MRKAIIAAIVASALFAVGAFAADFALTSEDVASGDADVVSCADEADVDFTTADDVSETGEFIATGADIAITEREGADCSGQAVRIAVGLDTDADESDTVDDYVEFDCDVVASAASTCEFGEAGLDVSEIEAVSVLIEETPVSTV